MNQLPPIISLSPLRSAVFGWRAAQARMLTLVCKATYALRPGESPLADEQEDPNERDDHWDDDPEKSLHAPSDFVPSKPRAELMVVGSAFAPGGVARSRVAVRVIVGDVDKALAVIGDRALLPDGSVSEPAAFTKMALRYERAAGGPGTLNPVGVRAEVDSHGKRALPNIVQIETPAGSAGDFESVGLGPIAPHWPLRAAHAGNAAARGDADAPWPIDDASFALAAPWDQQLEALRPNERIVLENLHPSHARLVTSLPGVEPRAFVDVERGAPHEFSMRCDTLWIDTDRGICTLTWRGQLPAEHPQPARIIVASSTFGRRLAWGDIAPLVRSRSSSPEAQASAAAQRDVRIAARDSGAAVTQARDSGAAVTQARDTGAAVTQARDTGAAVTPARDSGATTIEPRREPVDPATPTERDADGVDVTAPLPGGAPSPALPFVDRGTTRAPSISPPAGAALPFVGKASAAATSSAPAPTEAARASTSAPPPAPPPSSPSVVSPPPLLAASVAASPAVAHVLASASAMLEAAKTPLRVADVAGAPTADAPSRWDPASKPGRRWSAKGAFGQPAASTHTPSAAPDFGAGSAVAAASNAAAQIAPPAPVVVAKSEAPAAEAATPAPPQRSADRTFVDLLWFDPAVAKRLRSTVAPRPFVPEMPAPRDATDEKDPDVRERREVLKAMTSGSPLDGEALRHAIEDQFADPATHAHPLVLVTGELAPSFDELATLKAAVQLGLLLGGGDKRTRDAAMVAGEALKSEPPPPRDAALALARSVVEAASKSGGPPLQQSITRLLLDQRAFRKRHLFGAPRVRMELSLAGATSLIPVYLPEAAEEALPCLTKLRVRLVAEVRPQEDYAETATESFLAFALARVLRGT
jgi:hypothetical protein